MRRSIPWALVVGLCLTALSPAPAAILTVDILADENDVAGCVPGDCSLREAINAAADADEIEFALPGAAPWTIRLTTALGPLMVDQGILITGPGADLLSVSGDQDGGGTGDVRVMRVTAQGSTIITGITFRDGRATLNNDPHGGCVYNNGDPVFVSCRFVNCRAWSGSATGFSGFPGGSGGAIYSVAGAPLATDLTTFDSNAAGTGDIDSGGTGAGPGGNGGAILAAGPTTIRRSTFTGNAAGNGGVPNGDGGMGGAIAVAAGGSLLLENSTLSGNRSGDGRNSVPPQGADGVGGGIWAEGDTTLNNVTLSGNTIGNLASGTAAPGGGIAVTGGTVRLRNATIAGNTANGNGGGLYRGGGTVRPRNTLIALNTGAGVFDDCSTTADASLISEGYNLVGINDGCAASFVGTGDQVGTSGAPLAPGLDPLGANGGPTQTRALQGASPAIDAGDPTDCDAWDPVGFVDVPMTADQRGFPRPVDGDGDTTVICDIGSFEASEPPPSFVLDVVLAGAGSGSVASTPPGIACPSDCSESYTSGTVVDLTPTPAAGSAFTGWSGDCTGSGACSVTMDAARTVTATFEPLRTLTVSISGSGSVASVPPGIACPSDCTEDYVHGTSVSLTPTPAAGWAFSAWSGDCTGSGACTVSMTANRGVTATFVQLRTLTVAVVGSGTVTSVPPGISCPSDCTQDYPNGTPVALTATPAAGFVFGGWTGDCTGTGACNLTMSANRSVTATFLALRTLTVSVTGNGTVTSVPAGISCPADCTEDYPNGTSVSLTPTPDPGWEFSAWSGACTGAGACDVSMTQNRSVTATFVPLEWTLDVAVAGNGTVTSVPAGISCPGDCSEIYSHGTPVALTATPSPGWVFAAWSGDCTGGGACNVTMDQARAVTATFTPIGSWPLQVTVTGDGDVASAPPGIACPSDCTESYTEGTPVSLTATPHGESYFVGWSGDCTGTGVCDLTMSQARAVTAAFDTMPFLDGFESGDTARWSNSVP